jgi:PAS domain S-box-containing protein
MEDEDKTRSQLVRELKTLRRRVAKLKDVETRYKEVGKTLRESEGSFRLLFANNPLPMWVYDLETLAFLAVNDAAIHHYGYSRNEFLSMTIKDIRPEEDIPALLENISNVTKGLDLAGAWRHLKKDGSIIDVEIISHTITFKGRRAEIVVAKDITETKRAEEELSKLSSAVKNTADSVVITDPSGAIEYVNPAFEKLSGYSKEEVIGKTPRILKSGKHSQRFYEELWQTILAGEVFFAEFINRKKDGRLYYQEGTITPIKDEKENIRYFVSIGHDITERKQAEEALRESEERFRRLSAAAFEGIVIHDQGKILDANQTLAQMLGYEVADLIGKNILSFAAPECRDVIWKNIVSGYEKPYQGTALRKDGSTFPVEVVGRLAPYQGRMFRVTAIRDITERKQVEEALRESEEKFRSLAEKSPNMIFINRKGRIVYVNEKCEEIMGYKKEEFYAPDFDFTNLIASECRPQIMENFKKHLKGEQVLPYEYTLVTKKGKKIAAINTTRLIKFGGERAILGIITDITERKRAEEALKKSEKRFRDLFENSLDAIFVHDIDGNLLDINPTACRLHRMEYDELITKNVTELVPPENSKAVLRYLKKLFKDGYGYSEGLSRTKDGQDIPVEIRATRIQYADRPALLLHVHDISKRKRLEEQLLQAQKMEAIGSLAGGIAHDFNNLLTVILGNAEFGLENAEPNVPIYQDLVRIEEAAKQARDLITQLLTFSRRQLLKPKLVDLNITILDLMKMLKRIIGEDIALRTKLDQKLRPIWADPAQVHQVLMNCAVNARDAMPKGGKLRIETRNFVADENFPIEQIQVDSHPELKYDRKNLVEITIADTGVGMDKETLARIFEPFFTTKELGKGTGLGLSVVYGIVKQHGGVIQVDSESGKGTTFKIYFPAVPESDISYQKKKTERVIPGGKETILVVEDEEAVRNVTVRILCGLGYKVMTAKDGLEALEVFEEKAQSIHLVILDLVMPKVSGTEAYKKFRLTKPDLPVIFVTGYDVNADIDKFEGMEQTCTAVLQKPYTRHALGLKVRALLDQQGERRKH